MNWFFLAASAQQQQPGFMSMIMPLMLMLPIFYFMLIRPQQKKQKQFQLMMTQLKKNDKVVTAGGIHGLIVNVKEQTLTVKIADNVKIEIDKSSVSRVLGEETEGEQGK
jgi:preprotein translocase subunit YajC